MLRHRELGIVPSVCLDICFRFLQEVFAHSERFFVDARTVEVRAAMFTRWLQRVHVAH